jgi:hypothetical protein
MTRAVGPATGRVTTCHGDHGRHGAGHVQRRVTAPGHGGHGAGHGIHGAGHSDHGDGERPEGPESTAASAAGAAALTRAGLFSRARHYRRYLEVVLLAMLRVNLLPTPRVDRYRERSLARMRRPGDAPGSRRPFVGSGWTRTDLLAGSARARARDIARVQPSDDWAEPGTNWRGSPPWAPTAGCQYPQSSISTPTHAVSAPQMLLPGERCTWPCGRSPPAFCTGRSAESSAAVKASRT